MRRLADTLVRNLNKDKEYILKTLEKVEDEKGYIEHTIILHEEEGEILITLLMTDEEIEKSVKEAVSKVLPNKSCSNILVKNEYISFRIE